MRGGRRGVYRLPIEGGLVLVAPDACLNERSKQIVLRLRPRPPFRSKLIDYSFYDVLKVMDPGKSESKRLKTRVGRPPVEGHKMEKARPRGHSAQV